MEATKGLTPKQVEELLLLAQTQVCCCCCCCYWWWWWWSALIVSSQRQIPGKRLFARGHAGPRSALSAMYCGSKVIESNRSPGLRMMYFRKF